MKRLFQRRASSSSAPSSTPASPDGADPKASPSTTVTNRHSTFTPATSSIRTPPASTTGSSTSTLTAQSPPGSPPLPVKAAAAAATGRHHRGSSPTSVQPMNSSVSADELHAKVIEFVSSQSESMQRQALEVLCIALTESKQGSGTERGYVSITAQERITVISVCAQRVQQRLAKALESYNADRMQGNQAILSLSITSERASDCVSMLTVLSRLMSMPDSGREHAVLLAGERLPSTLVKLLKAMAPNDSGAPISHPSTAMTAMMQNLLMLTLEFLGEAIRYEEVVQELIESSTMHRLFHLSFQHGRPQQLAALSLIEKLVRSKSREMWKQKLVPHFLEHKCLLGLLATVGNDAQALAKVISISSYVLKCAIASVSNGLHEQLRQHQYYHQVAAHFAKIFESTQLQLSLSTSSTRSASMEDALPLLLRDQEAIALALGELALSGNESGKSYNDVASQKYFALLNGDLIGQVNTRSLFNADAFQMLTNVLEYLHYPTPIEKQTVKKSPSLPDSPSSLQKRYREQLECKYVERIGRILCQNRYDYVLVMKTQVLEQMLYRLDAYPEITRATIGSVLSAIAIETNVIPYAELAAINQVLRAGSVGMSSVNVLLGFLMNLLRFHGDYTRILRKVGVIDGLLTLFQTQAAGCLLPSKLKDPLANVNVAYPTSVMKLGAINQATAEYMPVSESNLLALLVSHCRPPPASKQSQQQLTGQRSMSIRDFVTLMDVLTVFADAAHQKQPSKDDADEDYYARTLCSPETLECVCLLIARVEFQNPAIVLWSKILHVALTFKRQNTSIYNSINCIMQSIRCAALPLCQDDGVKSESNSWTNSLLVTLGALEEIVRPSDEVSCLPPINGAHHRGSRFANLGRFQKPDCDQILVALVDCGGVSTCLAVLHALNVSEESNPGNNRDGDSLLAVCLTMKLIHLQITQSKIAGDTFARAVTFGFYGDLLYRFFKTRRRKAEEHEEYDAGKQESDCLLWSVQALLGVSVGESTAKVLVDIKIPASQQQISNGAIPSSAVTILEMAHPAAFGLAIQLLSLWSAQLPQEKVDRILDDCCIISAGPGSSKKLASCGTVDILIRSFGSTNQYTLGDAESRALTLHTALLSDQNVYHAKVVRLLRNIAPSGISYQEISLWIRLMLYLSSTHTQPDARHLNHQPVLPYFLLQDEEIKAANEDSTDDRLTPAVSTTSSLLHLFVELASSAVYKVPCAPGVRFDVSTEGFAYLQIPEVHVRSLLSSSTAASSSMSSSSIPSFSNVSKIWPPADGYSVMLWFRVDALETKDEREKLYRECFMARKCMLCGGTLREETALKCSHRACRPCVDALLQCGGECVICNPPMFYLFRFRSGDSKSVSEAFLKGTKVFMRTSASRTVHQFSHSAIEANKWHHATFVHSRQRFQSSTISFYLNGVLQEIAKMSYPSSITSGQPLSGMVGIPSQARRVSTSTWTVGSFYLIDEPVPTFVINTVFAAGPGYDGLFCGEAGNGEIAVCFDHLRVQNLTLIDEYMRDPIRALIESVDAERVSKNSFIRGSLSLASAASSAAAAIVQDMKAGSSLFARIPSAVPLINVPISQDRVLLAYTSRNAVGVDSSIIPSTRLDGRPIMQLMGGSAAYAPVTLGSALYELCSSGCQFVYVLLEKANTAQEVDLSLRLLWSVMQGNAQNLDAMEQEHGYGVVNFLLHQKAPLLGKTTLQLLFRIVGIDIDIDEDEREISRTSRGSALSQSWTESRESSIRNLQALQYFVLDYSLWQKVDKDTQKLLFSSLYSCLVAGDEELRERNRSQLQSISIVRQLLYVFLDADVESDLLRVIVDLILVCLTGSSGPSVEANFADVATFLTSTLSPKFARSIQGAKEGTAFEYRRGMSNEENLSSTTREFAMKLKAGSSFSADRSGTIAKLCLSPRGGTLKRVSQFYTKENADSMGQARFDDEEGTRFATTATNSSSKWKLHQTKIQDLLLDILFKAVQKRDLKESKDRDELDGTVATNESSTGAATATIVSSITSSSTGAGGGTTTTSRIQLPSSHRLTGFRKVLSPRWMCYFLFPSTESFCSVSIASSTVTLALKLLCALLTRSRYEAFFKREGYYRLLSQGLPCDQRAFQTLTMIDRHINNSVGTKRQLPQQHSVRFPFDEMWYTLFCIMLGTPVDGIPHDIQFEMFFLSKDFELNIQSDRILNSSVVCVVLSIIRRHYSDPVAITSLSRFRDQQQQQKPIVLTDGSSKSNEIFHIQVLDFLHYLYDKMPSFHKLLAVGSDKFRMDFVEELTLLACTASRSRVLEKYLPSEKRIHQALLNQKRDLSAYEYAICAVTLAENAAAKDELGEDPFMHPTAVRASQILVDVQMNFLLDFPKGSDVVETIFDSAIGMELTPPLSEGLQLRFQSLVMLSLLEQLRAKLSDEEILTEHKMFAHNLRDFLKFAVQKMHNWQRAQHGDGCPPSFACCSKFHFAGGPGKLLELVLFVLAETSVGIIGGGSGFSVFSSSSSTSLSGILHDKLTKGKKRRQIRQIIDRISSSKPAELESLLEALYVTLNAVVLHVLRGHRVEVSDEELAAMLQLIHVNRDVVLGSRNNQDKDFFVCLCRYLLQLLSDSNVLLQEAAVHVWIDLLYFQRSFMVDLLTIEIRRAGALPYSVNLMKNGFDVLLECPPGNVAQDSDQEGGGASTLAINSSAFIKFKKWLELLGPPLKELEIDLDRTFLKSVVDSKEAVREAWVVHHKKLSVTRAKHARHFKTRYEWLLDTEKTLFHSLVAMQQKESRRQVKWRQDRIDRQKFIARQWQHIRLNLFQHALGGGITLEDAQRTAMCNPTLMHSVAVESSSLSSASGSAVVAAGSSWRLDFTEGPFRMRKRFSKTFRHHQPSTTQQKHSTTSGATNGDLIFSIAEPSSPKALQRRRPRLLRRRFSEGDLAEVLSAQAESSHPDGGGPVYRKVARQLNDLFKKSGPGDNLNERRHGSFEDCFASQCLDDTSSVQSAQSVERSMKGERRRDSLSTCHDSGGEDEDESDDREEVERSSATAMTSGGLNFAEEVDAIDEKLRPLLMPGDDIMDIYDCLRIDGMDSCPGVFILCSEHAYIVDNYQRLVTHTRLAAAAGGGGTTEIDLLGGEQNTQTRVVEISRGATTRLERGLSLHHHHQNQVLTQSFENGIQILNPHTPSNSASLFMLTRSSYTHQCRYWAYDDIVELHKRRYQLRHVAIEIFAHDGRNYLITFESNQQRENVFHSLLNKCPNVRGAANGIDRTAATGDLYSQLRKLLRNSMTERWIGGEISNFEYLMHLNTLAGRSYNDLTQYPVFPWVLSDYTSEVIDLNDPSVFRDLTKPMGALNREEEFRARYDGLSENPDASDLLTSKPFHYGTHYSSAAIVLYYLMRVEPFTTHLLHLQGGKYDHADRLFSSVRGAWNSAAGVENAQNGTQDVKELIPEFFYLPAFLKNVNAIEFGRDQNGTSVNDVELPPWAHGSAKEFVRVNREALESSFVSANLHHWIDLIFGYKQQGAAAVDACNVFYHLTYEGAVDLETISDPAMKRAIVDQINEFGQTPSQLFKTAHPARTRVSPLSGGGAANSVGPSSFSSNNDSRLFGAMNSGDSDHASAPSSSALSATFAAPSPMTSRAALASSFIGAMESSEIMNRMQTILSNTGLGGATDDTTRILDEAALLHQEPKRDVPLNPLLSSNRGQQYAYTGPALLRGRQLSPGVYATNIQQVGMMTGFVAREERVAAVGDKCLLIPPRNNEFLAWGFQDRSIKVLSAGSCELGSSGDSKVVASFETTVEVNVACITSDGRTIVTGGISSPVIRIWEFSSRKTTSSSTSANRRRAYTLGLHTAGQSARSMRALATLVTPAHHRAVTAVHACRAYSIAVSGCSGGIIVMWDLNRMRYMFTLPSFTRRHRSHSSSNSGSKSSSHKDDELSYSRVPPEFCSISSICINEVSGDIVVASGARFGVYDVNGNLLVQLCYDTLQLDPVFPRSQIMSLALNRSQKSEWSKEKAVITGHADGVLCIWAYSQSGYGDDEWNIELKGRHVVSTPSSRSPVTAVYLTADERKLYTGTSDGLLSVWTPKLPPAHSQPS